MIRLSDLKLEIGRAPDAQAESKTLENVIRSRLKINPKERIEFTIFKKSVDARKKERLCYVYTVDVAVEQEEQLVKKYRGRGIALAPVILPQCVESGTERMPERPVVIGTGPAGLFAGLFLSRNGYRPILLERGDDVDVRTERINQFWQAGRLDTESNVQFGEGGAGTFSDGKLTTLINDRRCHSILEEFVRAGAPPEILYQSKPHIGTDLLKSTVKNIRQEIIAHGGEVRFRSKVTDFIIRDGRIRSVIVNENEEIGCGAVLLAIGHSARDTFEVLHGRGVGMNPKAFSIGVRIEHPQELIDKAQYGDFAGVPGLGAADYKLAYHAKTGRSAYTFCMCPGGYVVAAASEKQGVVTNGMSEYKRDGANANAALLVGVTPEDFQSRDPLAGIAFQRKWERLAYQAGGESYRAPAQLTGDFLAGRGSTACGAVKPTYSPGVVFTKLESCLPEYVIDTMKEAIAYFDTKIKGFALPDSILTGVETRSSSPVRINRDDSFQSNVAGLYPVGEGAGYAGGIMSSAVDGVRTAEKVIAQYAPIQKE